jgi:hypothetical protein
MVTTEATKNQQQQQQQSRSNSLFNTLVVGSLIGSRYESALKYFCKPIINYIQLSISQENIDNDDKRHSLTQYETQRRYKISG